MSLRIERNGQLVEIPRDVEAQGPDAVEAYVAEAAPPTKKARKKTTTPTEGE